MRFQDFTIDFKISRKFSRFQDFTKDFKISRKISLEVYEISASGGPLGLNTQTAELPQHTFHTHNHTIIHFLLSNLLKLNFISYVVLSITVILSVYIVVFLAVVKDHS